jgi:hypothetical protein
MIKFFRKIRQKLLSENKISKYILYALGEIILVVIGILIALSVNNFNNARIDRNEETEILKALQVDFRETKKSVEKTIELQQRVVSYCHKLKIILNEKTPSDSIGEYLFQGALSYWRIEPVNGTYDALIGSGKSGILSSEKLKRYLALYSSQIKYGFEDEKFSLDLTLSLTEIASENSAILLPNKYRDREGLTKYFTDKQYKKAVSELLNSSSFLGILIIKSAMEENRLEYQKSTLKGCEIILDEIDNELNFRNL